MPGTSPFVELLVGVRVARGTGEQTSRQKRRAGRQRPRGGNKDRDDDKNIERKIEHQKDQREPRTLTGKREGGRAHAHLSRLCCILRFFVCFRVSSHLIITIDVDAVVRESSNGTEGARLRL